MTFNHGLPIFDHGAHFVMDKIHAMEVGQILFFSWIYSVIGLNCQKNFIILQISKTHFKKTQTILEAIRYNFLWILVTSVFLIFFILNIAGTFMSHQSWKMMNHFLLSCTFFKALFPNIIFKVVNQIIVSSLCYALIKY